MIVQYGVIATTYSSDRLADKLRVMCHLTLQSRPFGVALLVAGWDEHGPVL